VPALAVHYSLYIVTLFEIGNIELPKLMGLFWSYKSLPP
jgi:hypothetical protein